MLHRLISFFSWLKHGILDILFPVVCLGCKESLASTDEGDLLCAHCLKSIVPFDAMQCAVCGARTPLQKPICHTKSPFLLAAAASYDSPVLQTLIWELKYHHRSAAARPLASLMVCLYQAIGADWRDFVLVPIPLHPSREKKRGYNQALCIASEFGLKVGIPVVDTLLLRAKKTKTQVEVKTWDERAQNMLGAFSVSPKEKVPRRVILVDDVYTSGATLMSAAETLYLAGVKEIIALTAARAR